MCTCAGFVAVTPQQYATDPSRGQTSYSRNSAADEFGVRPDAFELQIPPIEELENHEQYESSYTSMQSNSRRTENRQTSFQNQYQISSLANVLEQSQIEEHVSETEDWQNQNYVSLEFHGFCDYPFLIYFRNL